MHLVWAPLGPGVLADFLGAYRDRRLGREHDLVVLLNGFGSEAELAPFRELLADVDHEELRLEEPVLDLAAYLEGARRRPAARYCFLNSYAEPLVDDWLAKLDSALSEPGTGIVGATASWGSLRSYQRFSLGLGGPYADVFADRRATAAALAAVAARQAGEEPDTPHKRAPFKHARLLLEQNHGFLPFPARHIRTNGFMLTGEVLSRLRTPTPRRKADTYRLESGRRSLTSQVLAMGLEANVVTREGTSFAPADWPTSRTFWSGDQEGLMIADNQTRLYAEGDAGERMALSRYAWGRAA